MYLVEVFNIIMNSSFVLVHVFKQASKTLSALKLQNISSHLPVLLVGMFALEVLSMEMCIVVPQKSKDRNSILSSCGFPGYIFHKLKVVTLQ